VAPTPFETAVFVNCPFDAAYEPILHAVLFCIVSAGLTPRIATERADSGETRIEKIRELIEASKFSIHDLSRCQAEKSGEHYRLNMPFELGLDFGCRAYCGEGRAGKKILILEEQRYRYQAAISDLAGFDIEAHGGDWRTAVAKVRKWLSSAAGLKLPSPNRIVLDYEDFQEWYWEKRSEEGWSEETIKDYPTHEFLQDMQEWMARGRPL
jgi:hypothetical protein